MIGRRSKKVQTAGTEHVSADAAPVAEDAAARLAQLPAPVPVERAAPIPPLSSAAGTSALDASARLGSESDDNGQTEVLGGGDGTQARPGWYPDPAAEADHRWWDGTKWTNHVS